jgi:hypothetical protein
VSVDNFTFSNLTLIQLDIEGFELNALKGAKSTIAKHRPIIAIEDNNGNCSEFLSNVDYSELLRIPGLHIWSPNENSEYKKHIVGFRKG